MPSQNRRKNPLPERPGFGSLLVPAERALLARPAAAPVPSWRNWQTRTVQVRVGLRP